MQVCVQVCVHVCVQVCACACVQGCACVQVCVHVCTCKSCSVGGVMSTDVTHKLNIATRSF